MDITIALKGTSPLLMHNPRMVDPDYEISRAIKALTGKRKKTDEDLAKIGELEWYGGIYVDKTADGKQHVVQPTSKVRKCIINAAKISKQGTSVQRSLIFHSLNVPLAYDGPSDIEELFEQKQFHSRLSVGVRGNRVMRVRPQFFPWALECSGTFIENAGLNFDELAHIVELAGIVEGVGDNRVNGYGRFVGAIRATPKAKQKRKK